MIQLNVNVILTMTFVTFLTVTKASPFLNMVQIIKTLEETRIDCADRISTTGLYAYQADLSLESPRCTIYIDVPKDKIVVVRPTGSVCDRVRKGTLGAMCGRLNREIQLQEGSHELIVDPSESVTFSIAVTNIMRVDCFDYIKDLRELTLSTVVLNNTQGLALCPLQFPPAIEMQLVGFQSIKKRKCCSDVIVASTDEATDTAVDYSDSVLTCEIAQREVSISTKCTSTFLYLRNSMEGDSVYIRALPLPNTVKDDCVPTGKIPDPGYSCKKKKPKF